MKQIIGVIGATGDLGAQLVTRLKESGFDIREYSRSRMGETTIADIMKECAIVHVCAPLEAVKDITPGASTIIVLHDSVMSSSKAASEVYLHGSAAIVHMLMNDRNSVVVATDALHHEAIASHMSALGLHPEMRTISEHDYLIARSQAPLALLCKVLLPYLYEQADHGMLTPSGQLLADTLRSRESVWTDATMHSILKNPELQTLINDMQQVLTKNN